MDQYMKIKKTLSLAESTRQILNKAIDLLHKLSNGKISKEETKHQLSSILSHYFLTIYGEDLNSNEKQELKAFLASAHEVVDKVDGGKIPLYEAIMVMNKVIIHHQMERNETVVSLEEVTKKSVSQPSEKKVAPEPTISRDPQPIEVRNVRKKRHMEEQTEGNFENKLQEIASLQKRLQTVITELNDELYSVGFELHPITKQ